MKTKLGSGLILLGLLLIAGALGLFASNLREEQRADEAVSNLMPQLVEAIQTRQEEPPAPPVPMEPEELSTVEIDGYGYVGFVGIPALNLELPVMTDWSYSQLQIAPCRYSGDLHSDDLVIMAHNYRRHFGSLSKLRTGDTITFTDMDAETTEYEVVALDVLAPTAIEEMTAGDYDLTLFTCTYGGQSRVTVRCDRIEK